MVTTNFDVLAVPAVEAAQRLLGTELTRIYDDGSTAKVRIVETEAYDQTDAASHSYKGRTLRTDVMFGPAGHLYVYFTYGMHYCMNVVCGQDGQGSGILIRAVEPLAGESNMSIRRAGRSGYDVSNGPAKLCQALAIDKRYNGHDLRQPPLELKLLESLPVDSIVQTTRIGISQAKDIPWRFYIKDNSYVSKR